jgi:hypothetical protein
MNSSLHSYFAELAGSSAAAGSVLELVQDNARVPVSNQRRNTSEMLSKASTRWHSGDSICDMARGDQCLPRAPTRRKKRSQSKRQPSKVPVVEDHIKDAGHSRFESTKKQARNSFSTVSPNISSILRHVPCKAPPSSLSQSETFDICRALDDVTSMVCQEDSSRKVRERNSRRQRRDLSPRPPNPMKTRSLRLMMI